MKRLLFFVSVFLAFVILQSFFVPQTFAEKKKPKEIILSTIDIDEDYELIGIVSARTGEVNIDKANVKLKEEAKRLGADYVIGVRYFNYGGYLYAYGTAVKIKEKETLR
ncbi:MAG: hypothetical protein AMJ78_05830 [Omnitrophica WOR_2 bacterium SM23_29]|nr:MAG: hypothetical protein AMJ78_05830 [Omnitrophica WOR_2 bacterium SM23_29]